MEKKLLAVVDNEPNILDAISGYLSNKGFVVEGLPDAESLYSLLKDRRPVLIILDLMLPDKHGFDICKELKASKEYSGIPIIILSANTEEKDKVLGLDLGADDYVSKPFSLQELYSRVNAVLRRNTAASQYQRSTLIGDILSFDVKTGKVNVSGREVALTQTELKILECLYSAKGQALSRKALLNYLWGEKTIAIEETIDMHVKNLKSKLGKAGDMISTVRGEEYKFTV